MIIIKYRGDRNPTVGSLLECIILGIVKIIKYTTCGIKHGQKTNWKQM